jgi:hypothetical protein
MRKTLIHLLSVVTLISAVSCGSKKNGEEIVAPQGMHTLDLTRYGKPFAIFVPDTVANKLQIIEQSNGALDIKAGKIFAISINEQAADIEMHKRDIKEDEVNKFKNFISEEPQALMWESEIVQPEFHFILNQKVGNAEYSFEDVKDTEANPFGKEAVQKMFDSAKNIKEIKKENNS